MQGDSPDGEPLRSSFGTIQPLIQGRIISFSSAAGPVRKIHKFHHNVPGALSWGWGGTNLFQVVLSSFQSQTHKCFEYQWWNNTLLEIPPKIHKRYTAPDIWEIWKPPLSWPPSPSRCNDHPHGFPGSGCVEYQPESPAHSDPRLPQQRLWFFAEGRGLGKPGLWMCYPQRKALLLTGKWDFFFCLTLNNRGRVGYYLIHNGSMHLLRTMGWHSWKIKWNFNVCKIIDNVTFASGLARAFIHSLQLRCHCCV